MKQETISNKFTPVQVVKFQCARPESDFYVKKVKYTVHETHFEEHLCSLCAFKEMSVNCPRQTGERNPVCFAKNRPDRNSVYYTKNEVKILTWTKD